MNARWNCLLGLSLLAGCGTAVAAEDCDACRVTDEVQVGEERSPAVPLPEATTPNDPRGKVVDIPIPGLPTVRHRPGAGVWVGEAGKGNNVFVDPRQNSVTLGVKRDF